MSDCGDECEIHRCGSEGASLYPNEDDDCTISTLYDTCPTTAFDARSLGQAVSKLPKWSHVSVNVMVAGVGVAALLLVVGRMLHRSHRHGMIEDSELLSDGSEAPPSAQ